MNGLKPAAMRIMGLNVRHGGGTRIREIVSAISALVPDVIVLSEFQDSIRGQELLDRLASVGIDQTAHSNAPDRLYPNAVCIASRRPLEDVCQPLTGSTNGHRVLEARVAGVLVVGVYFPSDRTVSLFWRDEFLPYARERLDASAVLLGDWNSGSHHRDEAGATLLGSEGFEEMSTMGWLEAWRTQNPEGREYTWYSPKNNGFRIDHAFISPSLAHRLAFTHHVHETRRDGVSDHSALVVDLLAG